MIVRILLPLLLATSTPVLATPPGGVWFKDDYFPQSENAALCEAVAQEVQEGVDEGYFSPDYAETVYQQCLEWAEL